MKIDQVDAESRVLHVARLKSGVTDDTALTRATDIGESRFWRLDHPVDYGARNGLASHRLNPKLITQNWDDFLPVADSLKMGKLSASELIHALQRGSKRSLLARALGKLGRIPKTLHLLTFIDDPCYRRGILTQLNRGEGRHRLARKCFHGQRGELRQRYREGSGSQCVGLYGTPDTWTRR